MRSDPPHQVSASPPRNGRVRLADAKAVLQQPGAAHHVLPEQAAELTAAVNRLAWPIIAENLTQTSLGIVSLAMVARLGPEAIAGVGAAAQLIWLAVSAVSSVTVGTMVVVAHFTGAGQRDSANAATKQSLWLALPFGAVLGGAGLLFGPEFVRALGVEPSVVETGGTYLRITLGASVFMVLNLAAGAALRGAGDSRTPMLVSGVMTALNLVLAYLLIFGAAGLPALGVSGAALASAITQAFGAAALLVILASGRRRVSIRGSAGWRPDLDLLRRILRVGLPATGEAVFFTLAMVVYSAMVVTLGTAVFAANRITFYGISLSFMLGMGYAAAATALVGQALGAGRPDLAKRAVDLANRSCLIWMAVVATVLFVFAEPILRVFSSDPVIVETGAAGLRVLALSQPLAGPALVLAGGLRGAGDTRFVMWTSTASAWLIRVPFGYLIGIGLGFGLPGVYLGNLTDLGIRAALGYARFRSGRWRANRV